MTDVMSGAVSDHLLAHHGRPCYVVADGEPVFAMLHVPAGTEKPAIGAVLCAPFGWDELSAHRSLRALAEGLARAGHAALRIDLPGCGDSAGSPRDPQRLEAWTAAVAAAAGSLRATTGCERVVAFGIGLGGMIACRALSLGAEIDDLALWSVPARGSMLLRELRAFARIAEAEAVDSGLAHGHPATGVEEPSGDSDDLNVAGFVLTAETLDEFAELDLTALPLPGAEVRRVLLLGRDGIDPDRRLVEHLDRAGVALTIADGPGYGAMMVDPYVSEIPQVLFAGILAWLAEEPGTGAWPASAGAWPGLTPPSEGVEFYANGTLISETPFDFDFAGERLAGVLTEPSAGGHVDLCMLLLNAGAVRRIGPQRLWVEAARRWAARGVATLRFDIVGVGDSDGDEEAYTRRGAFQQPEFADQVIAAMDALQRRGVADNFGIGGVCSGAYWALNAALRDERVSSLLLLNLLAFRWSTELGVARDARRARALLGEREVGKMLRIVATDRWRISRMLATKLRELRLFARRDNGQDRFRTEVVEILDRLQREGVSTLLLLSLEEPMFDDFVSFGLLDELSAWPLLRLERIATGDHIFRPIWCQRHVHETLDEAVERTLLRLGERPRA